MNFSLFNFNNPFFKKKPEPKPEAAPEPLIGAELAAAYNQSRPGSGHRCLCYAPSANMLFSQDGSVRVCCHNMDYIVGKYPEQSIREIWNSVKAKEMRAYMRSYDLSHGCGVCEDDLLTRNFSEMRTLQFDKVPRHPEYPTQMEFLVSNQCNLECVMCKGEYSSLIRKNREKLPPIHTPYDDEFLKQVEEFIPYLFEARFSGSGEAFSIDMNYRIWEMLIERNPMCVIYVQTNGTILTERVKDVMRRGNFKIGVSLDSLQKETYESIRINANLDKVMENILYFNEYSQKKNETFVIAMCVMRQNWRELPGFIEYCNKLNAMAMFHKVWHPTKYALHNLPLEQLDEIYSYLSDFDFPSDTHRQKENRNHYKYFVSVIKRWLENARDRNSEINRIKSLIEHVQSLNRDELNQYLREKLKFRIAEKISALHEREALLESSMNKMETLLGHFEQEEKEKILRWSCVEQPDTILMSLEKYPVDYLIEQARMSLGLELEEIFSAQHVSSY